MRKELRFKAVHDGDFDDFLGSLGILDQLEFGQLRCGICEKKITRENLYCLYAERGEVKVCCDAIQCYEKILRSR